jgi:hypothetical protein
MHEEKWLEAAGQIDADIEQLQAAAAAYRSNADTGVPWPHDGEDATVSAKGTEPTINSDESRQLRAST